MRRTRYLAIPCGLLLTSTVLWAGCGTLENDCSEGQGECAKLIKGSGGSTSSSTTSTTSGTLASSSTGMDPGCAGDIVEGLSEEESKRLISETCGVFVQADSTAATEEGSQAAPYKSIQVAIDKTGNSKRVYVCANAKVPYAEAVTVSSPVEMYGSFECDNGWVFKTAARSLITGAAPKVSLTLTETAGGAKIEGFKITSASATGKGESSVAVAAADINAALAECDVEAGDGADGVDGKTPTDAVMNGEDAPNTNAAFIMACLAPNAVSVGGAGKTTCGDGMTAGGVGGKGGVTGTNNGDGQAGTDGTPPDTVAGKGGAGQTGAPLCVVGGTGKDGDPGLSGAAGTALGNLSLSGLVNAVASDGTDGKLGFKGQGGGGGGGVKSGLYCPGPMGTIDGTGASGGGGGAGGCGGAGGRGGKAGGSSIALISLGRKLALTHVTLKSGKGGNGGKGGDGQAGGAPGMGGKGGAASNIAGSKPGCKGGDGGMGGSGGAGGGGRGGHSLGLAVMGAPVTSASSFTPGTAGEGGLAGAGGSPTGDGSKGLGGSPAAACWDFSGNVSCAK